MVSSGGGGGGKAARAKAKSGTHAYGSPEHMDAAFGKSPGAKDNFVKLHDFRKNLGGTRDQQDAAIHAHRVSRRYSLDSHEGLYESAAFQANRTAIMDAAIHEKGSRYVYISKH